MVFPSYLLCSLSLTPLIPFLSHLHLRLSFSSCIPLLSLFFFDVLNISCSTFSCFPFFILRPFSCVPNLSPAFVSPPPGLFLPPPSPWAPYLPHQLGKSIFVIDWVPAFVQNRGPGKELDGASSRPLPADVAKLSYSIPLHSCGD